MQKILFNPYYKEYKDPVGALKYSDEIFITIKITKEYDIYQLRLVINNDQNDIINTYILKQQPFDSYYNSFTVNFKISTIGIYWYHFEFNDTYGKHYIGSSNNLDAVLSDHIPIFWQLSIHDEFISNLDWYKGKVMYQIMVDRFYNGGNTVVKEGVVFHENWNETPLYQPINGEVLNNDFFGGNIRGIIKKLEYLKSINVGIIYLNPIFEAYSNHKFDTGDYLKIDPMFGDESDFIELCNQAKAQGIYIILDGVFNHTGANSRYFNKYNNYSELGAYQSTQSKYFPWYRFHKHPDEYYAWWGINTLPSVNQNDQGYIDFITGEHGVIDKWIKLGARGFRLDVVDELCDNFIDLISSKIKSISEDNIIIGEVWEDASNKIAYGNRRHYFSGKQLDSVMNYPLKNAIIDFLKLNNYQGLQNQMRHLINNYPKTVIDSLMNHVGTHDTIRLLNNFAFTSVDGLSKDSQSRYIMSEGEYQNAVIFLKMATAIQFTLPGVPSILYGDETGIQGFKDPFCRKTLDWDNINQEIYQWYQQLSKIRDHDVYIDGDYIEENINNYLFAFSRSNNNYKIITIINNNNTSHSFYLSSGIELITNAKLHGQINISKQSAMIIKITHTDDIEFDFNQN